MFDALLNFLANQADYLSFAEGMILAALGITCLIMGRSRQEGGWHGLALFGGLLALNRWMGLAEQIPNVPVCFAMIRFLLELMAFASLLYFAYWGERKVRRVFAVGVIISLLAIVLVGMLHKRFSTASVSFGTLEWVVGGWAGGALYIMAQKMPGAAGWRLRMAAIPLVLYGLAVGSPSLMQSPSENAIFPHDMLFLLVRLIRPLMMAVLVWLIAVSARGGDDEPAPLPRRGLFTLSPMAWGLVAVAIMLVLCFELVNMSGAYGARIYRRGLLLRAQTAAAAVPQEWVQQLIKAKSSEISPVYLQTCTMLRDICSRNLDIHFVYLLAAKDGRVVFLANSEPPNARDRPQPGQVYENASDALVNMFHGGYSFADGDMENRGPWLCAFADVRAADALRASAVLGMDTDMHNAHQVTVHHRLAGIGLALVLNLLVLAFFAGLQINKDWTETSAALEQRFRAVFENAAESIFVFEVASGRIRMANPFACEWLGYQPEETHALAIQDVANGSLGEIRKRLLSGRKLGEEYTFRRKDESLVSGEMTGATLRLQEARCIVAFARDITARKRSEAELQRSLADLARFNRLMVGRETRVVELKQEVNALEHELSRAPTYASVEPATAPATPKTPEAPT